MRELALEFDGRGEVKGYKFTQKYFDGKWYIYEVVHTEFNTLHYELFKRIEKAANPPFALEDFVRYPNGNAFGVTAWTSKTYEKALAYIKKQASKNQEGDDLSDQSIDDNVVQNREGEGSEEED